MLFEFRTKDALLTIVFDLENKVPIRIMMAGREKADGFFLRLPKKEVKRLHTMLGILLEDQTYKRYE